MPFRSECRFVAPGVLRGFVEKVDQPDRHWQVGLFVDGELQGTCLSDLPLPTVEAWQRGRGFEFNLIGPERLEGDELTVLVVNTDHVVARFSQGDFRPAQSAVAKGPVGFVRHVQGLVLAGTIENDVTDLPAYAVFAREGDRIVGQTRLFRWQHVGDADNVLGRAAAFEIFLEPDLADGRVHQLQVETSTGAAFAGSPLDVIAWPNRLRDELLSHEATGDGDALRRRGDVMLERLLGASMPISAYASCYPELRQPVPAMPPDGQLGSDGVWRHIGATGWVLCWHPIVHVLPGFLHRIEAALAEAEGVPRLIGADLAVRLPDGQIQPLLFSAFDLERLLEQGHAALCFALPAEALAGGAAASLIGLLLGWLDRDALVSRREAILHVPHPAGVVSDADLIGSCQARSAALQVALGQSRLLPQDFRILTEARAAQGAPRFPALRLHRTVRDHAVSVIVPTRNRGAMLNTAVLGLIDSNPEFDLDVIVIDNASTEPSTLEVFDRLEERGVRIVEFGEGFNYALINNLALEHSRHEQICFMNNDVAFPETGVLAELCSRLAAPDVGAVGPLMTRASDIVQHGGVVLGPWHVAVHAFEDRMLGDPGYGEMLRVASEPSAVTGAFMLTRRSLFESLGGFNELAFPVNFNDVDYCLRLWQAGYRVVVSPHVRIHHFESVSRGRESATAAARRMQREQACLRARWRAALLDDPQYHPLWGLDCLPYRALSMTHRAPAARHAGARRAASLPEWL